MNLQTTTVWILLLLLIFLSFATILEVNKNNLLNQEKERLENELELSNTIIKMYNNKCVKLKNEIKYSNYLFYLKEKTKLKQETISFIIKECDDKNIPSSIIFALFEQETNFVSTKVGGCKELGLGQLHPNTIKTACRIADLTYNKNKAKEEIYSAKASIAWFNYLYKKFNKDIDKVLTAYNRGVGGLRKYIKINKTPISSYSENIKINSNKYHYKTKNCL